MPTLAFKSVEEVYVALARNKLKLRDVTIAIVPRLAESTDIDAFNSQTHFELGASSKTTPMPIRGASKAHGALRFSKKHPPIAGERIVGIIEEGGGLVIYPIDSNELEKYEKNPELWVDLVWDLEGRDYQWYTAPISITLLNEIGALSKISTIIAEQGCNIWNSYMSLNDTDLHHLYMDIEVRDIQHFN